MTRYTLVQHSAWTNKGDLMFKRGVELRSVTPTQAVKVEKQGGVVYPDYTSAEEAEMAENYPPEVEGLAPAVRGDFSEYVHIDGSPLYIPSNDNEKEESK